jgi:hypothetical protein
MDQNHVLHASSSEILSPGRRSAGLTFYITARQTAPEHVSVPVEMPGFRPGIAGSAAIVPALWPV